MIGTVVAKFQLKGLAAESQAADLMSQANSEDRNFADKLANVFHGIAHRLWITRAVREKYPVRLHIQNIFRHSSGRYDSDVALVIGQQAQDVLFDSEVVSDHPEFLSVFIRGGFAHLFRPWRRHQFDRTFAPIVRFGTAHSAGKL